MVTWTRNSPEVSAKKPSLPAGSEACTPEDIIGGQLANVTGYKQHTWAKDVIQELSDAGFVIVPKEPTEEMINAGSEQTMWPQRETNTRVYKAMIAASRCIC